MNAGRPTDAARAAYAAGARKAAAAALEDRRRRGIVAIKATQRQLGLDDATYRDLLYSQTVKRDSDGREVPGTGKRSATELSLHEQNRVLDYMRAQGAPHPTRAGRNAAGAAPRRRGTPSGDKVGLMRKVHALLGELGRVTGSPHTLNYADAICRRNRWAERVDFCSAADLHKLVGALARTVRSRGNWPGKAGAGQ